MKTKLCLLACLLVLSCGSESREPEPEVTTADQVEVPAPLPDGAVALATRAVTCGCAVEEIGHCGNYVKIDSRYVGIANNTDLGLGGMEWCGKSDVTAETAGEIKDGKFVVTTLNVVAPDESL